MSLQFDIGLFETNDGGDVLVKGNDLVKFYENEGQIYLALFGGNVDGDTPIVPTPGKERVDYFGNYFLSVENQFNSRTERTLNTTALGSQATGIIKSAVEYDLNYLKKYADIEVTVDIISVNVVQINIISKYFTGKKTLTIAKYNSNTATGDFFLLDFSTRDFF